MCGDLEMLVDVWRSGDVEIGEDVERCVEILKMLAKGWILSKV